MFWPSQPKHPVNKSNPAWWVDQLELQTLYSLTSVCIFSILFLRLFLRILTRRICSKTRASLVGNHLFYSHNLHVWFRGVIARRNEILVTLRGERVNFPPWVNSGIWTFDDWFVQIPGPMGVKIVFKYLTQFFRKGKNSDRDFHWPSFKLGLDLVDMFFKAIRLRKWTLHL